MTEADLAGSGGPPVTGHPVVDEAVASLERLADLPLAEHHPRLTKVHEVLDETLHPADGV